jgi:hypothetical protein
MHLISKLLDSLLRRDSKSIVLDRWRVYMDFIYLLEYGIAGAEKMLYTREVKHATGLLDAFSKGGAILDFARIRRIERLEQEKSASR